MPTSADSLLEQLERARGRPARLVEQLGAGGEGVALVVAESDGARRVVKILAGTESPHEGAHLASLRHPRIPAVHEVGRLPDGRSFVVRDHVEGHALETLPRVVGSLRPLLQQLLEVLAFVHQRSVLHLDLKPGNLVVDARGDLHLLDFGLAVRGGGAAVGGTPFFAAPEVLLGVEPDCRADLFSVGAMVVQALLPPGRLDLRRFVGSFPGDDFLTACGAHVDDLPEELVPFVMGCVRRRPQRRFPDADTALEVLVGAGGGRPSLSALLPDPVRVHAAAVHELVDCGARDVRIVGGAESERHAVALHLAVELGGVRRMRPEQHALVLVRGGPPEHHLELPPLTAQHLVEHLHEALALDGRQAELAAQRLLRGGATTEAVAAELTALVERGELLPSGLRWVWPAARSGRPLDAEADREVDAERDAGGESLAAAARRAAAAGLVERGRALWLSASGEHEREVRTALVEGLLDAGEPARALALASDLPLLRAQALVETGRLALAGRELAELGEPSGSRHRRVAARLALAGGDLQRARELLGHADADVAERLVLAAVHEQAGELAAAEALLRGCLSEIDLEREPYHGAAAFTALGHVARRRGDLDVAREQFERAVALAERLGHVRHAASCQLNLGVVAKDTGQQGEAVARFREAKVLYEHCGDRARATIAAANLGIAALARGDASTAREVLIEAAPRLLSIGERPAGRLAMVLLARAHAAVGDRDGAEAALAEVGDPDTERLRAEVELVRRELAREPDSRDDVAMPPADGSSGPSRELFRTFLSVNRRLAQAERLEDAMSGLLDAAVTLTGGRHGYLLVMREDGMRREFQSGDVGAPGQAFSRSLAHRAIDEQRTLTGGDVLADDELRAMQSVRNLRVRSAVCAPFRSVLGTRGAIYVEHPGRAGVFSETDKEALEVLADQAAIAVDRMLREERLRGELSEKKLELAVAKRSGGRREPVRLLGDSAVMKAMVAEVDKLSEVDLSVLILGETGTGKELVARALHERGTRRAGPFVAENCSALPAELMERELFGHVEGAFTGADRDRPGLLELANGGTLFLDEVGDMPPALQVKLLRALQERVIRRVGGDEQIELDLRMVAATHKDLRAMVTDGSFREDLYYRLAAVELRVPPLRERDGDIARLARHFVERAAKERGRKLRLGAHAVAALEAYPWPGNVRELEHVIARAAMLCEGEVLDADLQLPELPPAAAQDGDAQDAGATAASRRDEVVTLKEAERRAITAALRHHGGDKAKAARTLGISRTALYDKIKRLEIDV